MRGSGGHSVYSVDSQKSSVAAGAEEESQRQEVRE